MKHNYLLSILFLLFAFSLAAQCPIGNVSLNTQAKVNQFIIDYPNCTEIEGDLVIGYNSGTVKSNIVSLQALSNIQSINGSLLIERNENLTNLNGLEKLTRISNTLKVSQHIWLVDISALINLIEVNAIEISHNTHLPNLHGIENTPSILESLFVWNNYRMDDISQLSHITEVREDVSISLFTSFLNSLYGIHNIKKIGGELEFKRNWQLESLDWLNQDLEMGSLSIGENSKLVNCQSPPICRHIQSGKPVSYYDNNNECQISNASDCDGFIVRGVVFYDVNENGIQDENEQLVSSAQLTIDNIEQYTAASGAYSHFFNIDAPVTVAFTDDRFKVTTGNEVFVTEVEPFNTSVLRNDIGIVFINEFVEMNLTSLNAPMVCGESVQFTLQISNKGSTVESGKLVIQYNSEVEFEAILDELDYIFDEQSSTIEVKIKEEIEPFEIVKIPFQFYVGEVNSANEIIYINSQLYDAEDENVVLDEDQFYTQVLCSYDPNDIQVYPNRGGENYVSETQQLRYTIRFENKGNYYAKKVRITNKIPDELDINSFQFLEASHDVMIMREGHDVTFLFEDIYLPWTDFDENASMGSITYTIDINETQVEPLSKIENEANIYFDANPAINTNTALATIENTVNTSSEFTETDILKNNIAVDHLLLNEGSRNLTYSIYNVNGVEMSGGTIESTVLDVSMYSKGIYFISFYKAGILIGNAKWVKM